MTHGKIDPFTQQNLLAGWMVADRGSLSADSVIQQAVTCSPAAADTMTHGKIDPFTQQNLLAG
ncbi:hypothetical protein CQA78_30785, partial [Klebsiella pneumoniae]